MLRFQRLAVAAASLLLVLTGCLGQDPERVRVRRDPKIIDEEERRIRPGAYEEWLEEQDEKAERLRLTPTLKRERNYRETARIRVDRVLDGIHEDPFADFERDRLAVLYRNWADHGQPPPEPESQVAEAAKAAEEADEEGDEDEGDEDEGDEGWDEDDEDEDDDGW